MAAEPFAVSMQVRVTRQEGLWCIRPPPPTPLPTQRFLLGYEFPDTLIILASNVCYVHATAKKREHHWPSLRMRLPSTRIPRSSQSST